MELISIGNPHFAFLLALNPCAKTFKFFFHEIDMKDGAYDIDIRLHRFSRFQCSGRKIKYIRIILIEIVHFGNLKIVSQN